jgi:hypothetical protein
VSAQSTIEKLRKAVSDAQERGQSDQEIIRVLSAVAKSSPDAMRALLAARDAAVRENRTDLSAAIEGVMLNPKNHFAVPELDAAVGKALDPNYEGTEKPLISPTPPGTSLAKAVADSFAPDVTKATEKPLTPEEQAQVDDLVRKMRKVRADMERGI